MQNTIKTTRIILAIFVAVFSIFLFAIPNKTVKAASYPGVGVYTSNPFNWNYGPNPNDPNYATYQKQGITRTSGNYGAINRAVPQKVVYWDRPVTFYGVPPSPTHGASAITPKPPGKTGIYYDDLSKAGGPIYVSGANYGNGRPVGRATNTQGARAIVPNVR